VVRKLEGHKGRVLSVSFSNDGSYLLSGSCDKTAKLWDANTGTNVRSFLGHKGSVTSVAFSPNGKRALTGSEDGSLRLWDVATGTEICAYWGHRDTVTSVAFSSDGNRLLSGSLDKTLLLWDISRAHAYRDFEDHRLPEAAKALAEDPQSPIALNILGEWFEFRGAWDFASDLLERARQKGFEVSPLSLGQCLWHTRRYSEALREYQKELTRIQKQPASSDSTGNWSRNSEQFHLRVCIGALERIIAKEQNP
jgi:hypothetical protein